MAYTRDQFLRMDFTCDSQADRVKFKVSSTHASYTPWWKSVKLFFFGFELAPREISLGGKKIADFQFDSVHRSVTIEFPSVPEEEIEIAKYAD